MTRKILVKMVGCVAVLAILFAALPARAAVVSISGAAKTDDTFITDIPGQEDYNFGGSSFIEVGDISDDPEPAARDDRFGLVKWDLSAVSALAGPGQKVDVQSATVTMYYTGTGGPDMIVNLYFITAANSDWVEGTGNGATAVQNVEPTWRYKKHKLMPWASGQDGLKGAGIDYDYDPNDPNTPEIDCSGNDQNGQTFNQTVSILAPKVESWVNVPATNAGLLLKQKTSADSKVKFASSNNANLGQVPVLTITYSIVPIVCGDPGTGQLEADLSGPTGDPDCKVDRYDLAAFVSEWLDCSNPNDARCNQ